MRHTRKRPRLCILCIGDSPRIYMGGATSALGKSALNSPLRLNRNMNRSIDQTRHSLLASFDSTILFFRYHRLFLEPRSLPVIKAS